MELKKLIDDCIDALQEQANEAMEKTALSAGVTTNDGQVDLYYTKSKGKWEAEVVIYHDRDDDADSPNLCEFLSNALTDCVDWCAAEEEWEESSLDEWQEHGFRDAADFWHWKEGR